VEKLREKGNHQQCGGWGERTQEFVEKAEIGSETARKDRRKQGVNGEKRVCKT